MKTKLRIITLLAALGSTSLMAQVQIPSLMNYQGQLVDPSGAPLATSDYALSVSVYDSALGGTLIWGPQIFDGTAGAGHGPKIPVVQGYFNLMLGPTDSASTPRPLSNAFAAGAARYLEVRIGTSPPIAPRQQLMTTPYAFAAGKSAMADNSSKLNGFDWSVLFGTQDPASGFLPGSKIANGTLTFHQRAPRRIIANSATEAGDIIIANPSTGGASSSSSADTKVQAVSVITSGGPVSVSLTSWGTAGNPSWIGVNGTAGTAVAYFSLFRDNVLVSMISFGSVGNTLQLPPGSVAFTDIPSAGPHTYELRARQSGGGSWWINWCSLLVAEY